MPWCSVLRARRTARTRPRRSWATASASSRPIVCTRRCSRSRTCASGRGTSSNCRSACRAICTSPCRAADTTNSRQDAGEDSHHRAGREGAALRDGERAPRQRGAVVAAAGGLERGGGRQSVSASVRRRATLDAIKGRAMATVYLNGEYLPAEQARVSVSDRGFVFGDGVYEVIPVYGGRLFRLEQHLARLARSLHEIRLDVPLGADAWRRCLETLIVRNGDGDQSVYVQVTRGPAPRDHAFPKEIRPTIYCASSPLKPLPADLAQNGVAAMTLDDIRWQRCDIKAI